MTTIATLRNGDILRLGDFVSTDFHPKCEGKVFVIFEMTEVPNSESGVLCNVHLKGDKEKVLKTSSGKGLDANWFQPVKDVT